MPNRNRPDMPDAISGFAPLASLRLAGAMADFAWYLLIFLALKTVPRGAIFGTAQKKRPRTNGKNARSAGSTSHR